MEEMEKQKKWIQGVIDPNKGLVKLTALLFIIIGAVEVVINFTPLSTFGMRIYTIPAGMLLAAGVLLLKGKVQGIMALVLPALLFLVGTQLGETHVYLAILMLISAIGLPFDIRLKNIPLLNGLAVLLGVLGVVSRITNMGLDEYTAEKLLELGLPAAVWYVLFVLKILIMLGYILLNLSAEAKEKEKIKFEKKKIDLNPEGFDAMSRLQGVPAEGSMLLKIGAILLLVTGVYWAKDIIYIFHGGMYPDLLSILLSLLQVIAAVLLLKGGHEKDTYRAALILLLFSDLQGYINMNNGSGLWLLLIFVFMLLSLRGFRSNKVIAMGGNLPAIPLFNLVAVGFAVIFAFVRFSLYQEQMLFVDPNDGGLMEVYMFSLAASLLFVAGLILLNLSAEARVAAGRKGLNIDGEKYRTGFSGLLDRIYADVGGSLKSWGRYWGALSIILAVLSAVGALVCLILGLILIDQGGMGLLIAAGSCLAVALGCVISISYSWFLYAFGQVVDDVHMMRKDGVAAGVPVQTAAPVEVNPDELPEL